MNILFIILILVTGVSCSHNRVKLGPWNGHIEEIAPPNRRPHKYELEHLKRLREKGDIKKVNRYLIHLKKIEGR